MSIKIIHIFIEKSLILLVIFKKIWYIYKKAKDNIMQRRNICKFINPTYSENPLASQFILETNIKTMSKNITLTKNRIILVIEGEGKFVSDNETLDLNKGTLIFVFSGEKMLITHNNNCKYMYIDFEGTRANELIKRFNISRNNRCFTGLDGIIPLWEESLLSASENTIDLVAESMLIYAFSRLSNKFSLQDKVLNKILQITEEHFVDSDLSISNIADELGYNSKYLSHLFKKKMGKNFSEYLRCLRVKYAVSLFDNGIDSIKNVALLSGFSDPLYFSTVFKNILGMSPKEYLSKRAR